MKTFVLLVKDMSSVPQLKAFFVSTYAVDRFYCIENPVLPNDATTDSHRTYAVAIIMRVKGDLPECLVQELL